MAASISGVDKIIGHRGAPTLAPENTLASFRKAAISGARWVEFDVALTMDSRPVVFHDADLSRTTDGLGLLADTTLDALSGLDAGSWFSPEFSTELVPTLEETLDLLATLGLQGNIEIKPDPGRENVTAEVVLATAKTCWPSHLAPPLISSFSRTAVAVAKNEVPDWPRGLIVDRLPADWKSAANTLDIAVVLPEVTNLTEATIRAIAKEGYETIAWTVNELNEAETILSWGALAICTDIPGDMFKALL